MKKLIYFSLLIVTLSCSTPKNVVYFADAERFSKEEVRHTYVNQIQKDDQLSITVGSKSPELALPFNTLLQNNSSAQLNNEANKDGYLVSPNGEIIFPILGKIHVIGLTHNELADTIANRIKREGYINDPTVTVKLLNYKISVLGEVNTPGMKKIDSDRVTIFEALSMAGDLTIYGKRENISIIREDNGKREIAYVDISNKNIFASPYYYLRPNDVLYIEPNKKKVKQSVGNPNALSTIFSATSLVVTVINFLTR